MAWLSHQQLISSARLAYALKQKNKVESVNQLGPLAPPPPLRGATVAAPEECSPTPRPPPGTDLRSMDREVSKRAAIAAPPLVLPLRHKGR